MDSLKKHLLTLAIVGLGTFLLSGCGPAPTGTTTTRTPMGGTIQGTPLILTGTVNTFAGVAGSPGALDNTTGTLATFNLPTGMTTDGANLYVADTANHLIRQISLATGAVTTLAGTGSPGFRDDPVGTAAIFNLPFGITTDGTNLFVADTGNHKIRKIVISTGIVTTFAGIGIAGLVNGPGAVARFAGPSGITTDRTNLYVSDTNNNVIRKIVIATGDVSTLSTGLNAPIGITTDGTTLYVADTNNHLIRSVPIATGVVTTLAGSGSTTPVADGIGAAATFNTPSGITTDGTNLYVCDTGNHTLRKIEIATTTVTTIAGTATASGTSNGIGSSARFNGPYGITSDGVGLFLADSINHTVRRVQ